MRRYRFRMSRLFRCVRDLKRLRRKDVEFHRVILT